MRRLLLPIFLVTVAVACATSTEEVCDDVGDCSYGGATDWIAQCKASTGALGTESKAAGCGDLFDRYYDCAKSSYACRGNVATFPGCDRSPLDACLQKARNGTACAELASRCGDAGLASCTTGDLCKARCYLDNVKNACAPAVDELDGVAVCSASCL